MTKFHSLFFVLREKIFFLPLRENLKTKSLWIVYFYEVHFFKMRDDVGGKWSGPKDDER